MKKLVRSEESGFTLIEVMIVAGVFAVSMVVLMGSLMTVIRHSEIADRRVAAVNLNHSTFDFMRGADWDELTDFVHPITDPVTGVTYVDGLGDVDIRMWAIIPSQGTGPGGRLLLGSEAMRNFDLDDVPNPVEIQIEITTLTLNDDDSSDDSRIAETLELLASQEMIYNQSSGQGGSGGLSTAGGSYTFTASIMHAH